MIYLIFYVCENILHINSKKPSPSLKIEPKDIMIISWKLENLFYFSRQFSKLHRSSFGRKWSLILSSLWSGRHLNAPKRPLRLLFGVVGETFPFFRVFIVQEKIAYYDRSLPQNPWTSMGWILELLSLTSGRNTLGRSACQKKVSEKRRRQEKKIQLDSLSQAWCGCVGVYAEFLGRTRH